MSSPNLFLLIMLIIGATTQGFCQDGFAFKLYYRDPLTNDTVLLDRAYHFTRMNDTTKIKVDPKTGICELPAKGSYKLHRFLPEPALIYFFNGQNADTLNWPKLNYMIGNPHIQKTFSGYYFGNELADGHVIDYYKKEKKRAEGNFKQGRLVDKISFYGLDGKVIKTEYPKRNKRN